jgi:hypothetical protein
MLLQTFSVFKKRFPALDCGLMKRFLKDNSFHTVSLFILLLTDVGNYFLTALPNFLLCRHQPPLEENNTITRETILLMTRTSWTKIRYKWFLNTEAAGQGPPFFFSYNAEQDWIPVFPKK